jgi:hypothetical protein
MRKTIAYPFILLSIALSFCACAGQASTGGVAIAPGSNQPSSGAQSPATTAGEVKSKVPDGWVTEQPSSTMRKAQYKLPKVEGDAEDAELVLYFFGSGQGGTVQGNIDRWVDQMQQADGSASKDKAKTETLTVAGLKVTMVDVSGTYTAQMSPGNEKHYNNGNYRLRAAVVETPKGNYFAKLIGPEKTMSHWDQSFSEYVKSLEFK